MEAAQGQESEEMESGQTEQARTTPLDVLRFPIRVRIVEVLTDFGAMSPNEMLQEGLLADIDSVRSKTPKAALSHVAYHCRRLAAFGVLTITDERPVRGATEHFYEAGIEAAFEGEQWESMSEGARRDISRVMWQRFIAQVEGGMQQRTFDARKDRWLAWGPLDLDEEGWGELMEEISEAFVGIEAIRRRSEARLSESGCEPLRATYGLFGFESPKRRVRRTQASDTPDQ